ncbi:MAG: cytochrome B [Cyclobacteriaceae bacterium]|nr:cytochrome B [Cyclobacteriaceae bacterium]
MYTGLLHLHSLNRYAILLLILLVLYRSFTGFTGKKTFTSLDQKSSLWLLILSHLQLVFGLVLYMVSPWVKFTAETMKDASLRYWTVEHIFMMVIAITLITIARISSKRLTDDTAKHKRIFILVSIAFVIILAAIATSGRGFFGLPGHH